MLEPCRAGTLLAQCSGMARPNPTFLRPASVESTPLHIAWVHERSSFHGGAEHYILKTVQHLSDRGVDSSLFYDPRLDSSVEFLRPFKAAFPIVDLRSQLAQTQADIVYLHRYEDHDSVAALAEQPAPTFRFFHDHRPFCPREHKYTLFSKTTCERRVGVRCLGCLGFVNRGPNGLAFRSPGSMRSQWLVDRNLTGCIVASQYMVDHVAEHGFDRQRIHRIPLYAREATSPVETDRESDLLLFVGTLSTGKGLDLLLEAMRQMSHGSSRLAVIGDGPQRSSLEALSSTLQLGDRVRFLGSLSAEQVDRWYARATCLVVPSRSPETFAMVGPEAMRFGTPVVATDVGGVGEWLRHEQTGLLVAPGQPVALAGALDRVLTQPDLQVRWGENARNLHQEAFLPRYHIEVLLDLFLESRRRICAA